MLRYYHRESRTRVLGPGFRAVLWLQGCRHGCPGCIVPESWPEEGGRLLPVPEAVEWVLSCDVEGLTVSGGEPMLQAAALVALADGLRRERDLGLMVYTGYRLEGLQSRGTPEQRELLERVDLLVDGLYLEGRHGDLLWRGSSNQRLLALTDRYRSMLPEPGTPEDRGAGLEFRVEEGGAFQFVGVPPRPGFRPTLEAELDRRGVRLATGS